MTEKEIESKIEKLNNEITEKFKMIDELRNELIDLSKGTRQIEVDDFDDCPYLNGEYHDKVAYTVDLGIVQKVTFDPDVYIRDYGFRNHWYFPTVEFAEKFQIMTRFSALCLLYKWYHDRDYEPEWNDNSYKYYVSYNHDTKCFQSEFVEISEDKEKVYFSTLEVARSCADWLNSLQEKEDIYKPIRGNFVV